MKRLFVLLLAACLLVSAIGLTACSDKKGADQSDEEIIKSLIASDGISSPFTHDDSTGISYTYSCEAEGSTLVLKYVSKTELTQEQLTSEKDALSQQVGNAFNDKQMREIVDKLKGKGVSKPSIKAVFCNSDNTVFFTHNYDAAN